MIGAPMAGGPTTPELIAAVGEAGGLGLIGSGYLDAAATRAEIARVRELTDAPFGVNVFLLDRADSDAALAAAGGPEAVERYAEAIGPVARRLEVALAESPGFTDFDQEATLAALLDDPVAVVSASAGVSSAGASAAASASAFSAAALSSAAFLSAFFLAVMASCSAPSLSELASAAS